MAVALHTDVSVSKDTGDRSMRDARSGVSRDTAPLFFRASSDALGTHDVQRDSNRLAADEVVRALVTVSAWSGAGPTGAPARCAGTSGAGVVDGYPSARFIGWLCTIWAKLPHRGRTRVKMPANS
jgi:hypothetical protein